MKLLEKIKNHYSGFRTKTKGMKFGEFVQFIIDYYLKDFLGALAVLIVIAAVVISSLININTDIILHGVGVNLMLNDEGEKYITDDFFELHITSGRQKIEFSPVVVNEGSSLLENFIPSLSKSVNTIFFLSPVMFAMVSIELPRLYAFRIKVLSSSLYLLISCNILSPKSSYIKYNM